VRPRQLNRYRAAGSKVKIIVASQLRVVVFGARLIAYNVVWWRRRANQSLDASRASGLLSDNLRLTQLRAAASTPPLSRRRLKGETHRCVAIACSDLWRETYRRRRGVVEAAR